MDTITAFLDNLHNELEHKEREYCTVLRKWREANDANDKQAATYAREGRRLQSEIADIKTAIIVIEKRVLA